MMFKADFCLFVNIVSFIYRYRLILRRSCQGQRAQDCYNYFYYVGFKIVKKMKKILPLLKPIVEFSADIFPFVLIFYLVLFLLENLFIGIVSNNIDLNYFLIPVFIFGFLAVFANRENEVEVEEKKPVKADFILTALLAILSFVILFYKTRDQSWEGLAISLGGAILVGFVSLILMYPEKEEVEEIAEIKEVDESKASRFNFNFNYKRLFLSRVRIPIPLVLVLLTILVIFIPKNTTKNLNSPANMVNECVTAQEPTTLPAVDPSTKIVVFNAGAEKGEATRIGNLMKQAGYTNVEATDSAKKIDNALIEFDESNSAQAGLIADILKGEYLTVNRTPMATPSAEIRVSLGAQPKPIDVNPDYKNENLDFFFN
ncbi:LytR family transcriptional regulator [bacterium]|nr:MAG: LytR family transcriptional regulator [bacterium]